ncbi:S1C family serine protease [Candidatus Entotheonella palauensis]|uniref:S1C family serine protease n=1 Tax=Candidatus Entotheonella palauensis TaxID=93172 RepID=UPI0015C48EF1|nr:serine protease [Candidatus Entotheonella palauensis]
MNAVVKLIQMALLLLLSACTPQLSPAPPPVQAVALPPSGSAPITFYRLLFAPHLARSRATQLDTVLATREFPYRGTEEFSWVASRLLRQQGYTVLGMENMVFGKNDWDQASLQLGGMVEQLDLYTERHGAVSARLDIEWQLFDARHKRLRYTQRVTGHAKAAGTATGAVFAAFGDALKRLLAKAEFVAQVSSPPLLPERVPALAKAVLPTPPLTCPGAPELELPRNLEAVLQRVVTIQNGASHGSGVIVSPQGYVLTAEHVISGLARAEVRLRSAIMLQAEVLYADAHQDMALLKLPGRDYPCLRLRRHDRAPVGAPVYAIGTPVETELASSVTRGIVSAYRQEDGVNYLQTDAGINPGSSGGPLVDAAGRVLAIVRNKIVAKDVEGLAFGVPVGELTRDLGIAAGHSRF